MTTRRNFIRQSAMAGVALGLVNIGKRWQLTADGDFAYASGFIKAQMSAQRPVFTLFSTDSLGGKQFTVSPLLPQEAATAGNYISKITGDSIAYISAGRPATQSPDWQFSFQPRSFIIRSSWSEGNAIEPFVLSFAQRQNHCTVLGSISADQRLSFPCVLHLPGMGSFRISCNKPAATVLYDAYRFHGKDEKGEPYIRLSFDGANADQKEIIYTFESAAIHPDIPKLGNDPRFDGWRRNYINIFQLNPRRQVLANNSASDPCAFTLYMYAEMARKTPALAPGLTAMDLIRNSSDRYLQGMKGYGQVGYNPPAGWLSDYDSSDSAPSLIISACYYILDTKDKAWAEKNYA
ncbi:MAG: twin-arginine translocation signal domain-containing protein, partial [Bacteroidetes bacterium]|nr:twin-arginine translocation signal domain-containing protein [Bacteroidota bacterium]